jgi:site-specific recombinase XerD
METVSENSHDIYLNKIDKFFDFLVDEKEINDKSFQSYLGAMRIEEIQESLNWYITQNNIKKESVAWHYLSVIKRYFTCIYRIGIKNDNLIKLFSLTESNENSFQSVMTKLIDDDKRLEKMKPKTEIESEDFEVLTSECDQRLKELIEEDRVLIYNKKPIRYNDLLATLVIKVVIYIGASYSSIREIEVEEKDIIHNTITINGYSIHLPNMMSEQMNYYKNIRDKALKKHNLSTKLLFVNANGTKLSVQTSLICEQLKTYLGRGDVTGLRKFAIINMIEKGINESIIKEFADVGDKIFDYCQGLVNDKKNIAGSRYVDSKLRSIYTFDML